MPYRTLESARQTLGITVLDLWWTYFALGGAGDAYQLDDYLHGRSTATHATHNTIAQALNETFSDRGQNHPVPYRDES
jgi:hypothetical protein